MVRNKESGMTEFTFVVGNDKFKFAAETAFKAMELCNRQVIDKKDLHPMAWAEAGKNTFQCCPGNYFD